MPKEVRNLSLSNCLCVLTMAIGFVIPGFIDVHAHWEGFSDRFPAKSWEMETFLAYGITTLHKYVIHQSNLSSPYMNVELVPAQTMLIVSSNGVVLRVAL